MTHIANMADPNNKYAVYEREYGNGKKQLIFPLQKTDPRHTVTVSPPKEEQPLRRDTPSPSPPGLWLRGRRRKVIKNKKQKQPPQKAPQRVPKRRQNKKKKAQQTQANIHIDLSNDDGDTLHMGFMDNVLDPNNELEATIAFLKMLDDEDIEMAQ